MEPERIPLSKVFDVPFLSMDGTSIELASLLFLFLTVLVAANIKRHRQAARWFVLASSKGHAGAEAELGQMLFYGEGVRRNRVKGLVYMSKAVARSAGENLDRFRAMRRAALAEASEGQRNAAQKVLAKLNILPELTGATQTFGFAVRAAE